MAQIHARYARKYTRAKRANTRARCAQIRPQRRAPRATCAARAARRTRRAPHAPRALRAARAAPRAARVARRAPHRRHDCCEARIAVRRSTSGAFKMALDLEGLLGTGKTADESVKDAVALVYENLQGLINDGRLIQRGTHWKSDGGSHPTRLIAAKLFGTSLVTIQRFVSDQSEPKKRGRKRMNLQQCRDAYSSLYDRLVTRIRRHSRCSQISHRLQ